MNGNNDMNKFEIEHWVSTTLVRFDERLYDHNLRLERQIKEIRAEMDKFKPPPPINIDYGLRKAVAALLVIISILIGVILYILIDDNNIISNYARKYR